jgi:hypothetical protein
MLYKIEQDIESFFGINRTPDAPQPAGKIDETIQPPAIGQDEIEDLAGGEENVTPNLSKPSIFDLAKPPQEPAAPVVVTPPQPAPVTPVKPPVPPVKPPVPSVVKPFEFKKSERLPDGSVALTFEYNAKPERLAKGPKVPVVPGKKR